MNKFGTSDNFRPNHEGWGCENTPENILEQYKTLQDEGDLLLQTREKEVVLYKMTANNTKKTH